MHRASLSRFIASLLPSLGLLASPWLVAAPGQEIEPSLPAAPVKVDVAPAIEPQPAVAQSVAPQPIVPQPMVEEPSAVLPEEPDTAIPAEVIPLEDHSIESEMVDGRLRFSFSGASWRDVLEWIAEAGELSLYVDDVPTGSFTYSDKQYFTVDEAIARLNVFLLPRGFSLVKRGELLSVINLGDPRGLQQLDAMAKVVLIEDLADLNDHDVVKVFVPLGAVSSQEAINEFQPLSLMTTPIHLPKSNQLIITDTARNLRSALKVLDQMQQPQTDNSVVQRMDLKHVDATTVLMVARTHLGIPENEMSGIDITVTTDLSGKRLFVVGSASKVQRLESLIKVIDVPDQQPEAADQHTLVSYPVSGDNLQAIYNVLQTILADRPIRLSIQADSNSVVALADDDSHGLIRDTIEKLQAPAVEFAVVELGSIDPYFAVSLIGELFGDPDETPSKSKKGDDDEMPRLLPPKVDADPGNRRLFVRGTAQQIQQIETLVNRLESRQSGHEATGDLRFVPLSASTRTDLLHSAKRTWNGENCLQILPPATSDQSPVIERTLHPGEDGTTETTGDQPTVPTNSPMPKTEPDATAPKVIRAEKPNDFVSLPEDGSIVQTSLKAAGTHAPIRGQVVPNGILLQSDDVEALDNFEQHLRTLSSNQKNAVSPTIVYYLKYVSAEEAVKMLADLLDGGNALNETSTDTLVRGSLGDIGTYYGSLLFDRDGVTTVTAGTATIVSDARLNRLIVQGTKQDIATIENYMKIIDKDSSITAVETQGRSRIIELQHAKAEEVAKMIREAFPDRVDSPKERNQPQQPQPGPSGNQKGDQNQQRGFEEKPTRGSKPMMAVAVHEGSNSVVITAPDALFAEVQELVESVDQRSERAVRVITAGTGVNLEMIQQILAEQSSGSSSRSSSTSSRTRTTPTPSRGR